MIRQPLPLLSLLLASYLQAQSPALAQFVDEVMPEGAWGGFAAAQIYAQRTLYGAMQTAASWLNDYCTEHGRCLEPGDDIFALESELKALMPINPYTPSQGAKVPVRIVFDHALTESQLTSYRTKPPDSWRAPAGTITVVVSNTSELFVLWGAGFDQLPARHELSQRVLFVVRTCKKPDS